LRRRGLATAKLHVHLDRERPHEPNIRVLNLPFPVQNHWIVTKLLMLDLEARPPGAAVIGVNVEAIPAKPRIVQNGLFVPLSPEPEKLELTLARISAIVGEGNVGAAEILDSHARERFRITPFGRFGNSEPLRRPGKLLAVPEFSVLGSATAFRAFRPALEATVQMHEGRPVWIAFSGTHGAIETASGPWQASGDWWNSKQWAREEWDIQIEKLIFRIYRDVLTNRWFAEGAYD
jgi:protein ImuB